MPKWQFLTVKLSQSDVFRVYKYIFLVVAFFFFSFFIGYIYDMLRGM